MTGQTIALTTTVSSVSVTLVSLMVPNAIDSRPVNDAMVERGYYAAMSSALILGFAVSVLDGTIWPLIGAMFCGGMVIAAHNTIQHNGLVSV